MQAEIKDISGYEGSYTIDNDGNIYSATKRSSGKTLKPFPTRKGYLMVRLYKDMSSKTISVHRLVALTFIENPNNFLQVNHKDKNVKNNNASNLEWVTNLENMNHRYRTDSSDGTYGVYFEKGRGLWQAYIYINNKKKNLGRYTTRQVAIEVFYSEYLKIHNKPPW